MPMNASRLSPAKMNHPPSPADAYLKLKRALNQMIMTAADGRDFVPDCEFMRVFDHDAIEIFAMDVLGVNLTATKVKLREHYRKVIAILVLMDHELSFVHFWDGERDDSHLPLDEDTLSEIAPQLLWRQFNKLQYMFLATKFCEEPEPLHWPGEFVLPFEKKEYLKPGGHSEATVYKVRIHPSYDELRWESEEKHEHTYALKSAETTNEVASGKSKWEVEVAANLHIRNQHPNILPLLHSHTHGSYCNMIFPFADCNLREFYEREPSPPTPELRFHFIEQISRLIPALGAIHRTDMDMDSNGPRLVGYHRDLKPDNILVFEKARKFMISDLGLAEFRPYTDRLGDSGVPWSFGVSSYRAPECSDKGRMVGRGGDIWSLGCVLAEAITWCLLGKNGVGDFSNARSTVLDMGDQGKYAQDWFFEKAKLPSGKEIMRLKPQVRSWFGKLRKASGDDPLICDVLKIIETMLKENPRGAKGRPTAEKIDCEFYSALRSAAQRLGITLDIKKPPYYTRHEKDEKSVETLHQQSIPYSYLNRSASLKRERSTERGIDSSTESLATVATESTVSVVSSATSFSRRPSKRRRDVSPFAHLKRLDTMFLVDEYSSDEDTRATIHATVLKLAEIATRYDQDGVDLAFIYDEKAYFPGLATTRSVKTALETVSSSDDMEPVLSRRLDVILAEYVSRFSEDQFTKPLNLIVVTTGEFSEIDDFEVKVMVWAQELDRIYAPKSQLGLQFVLVNSEPENAKRFHDLDSKLHEMYHVRDMVDATPYDPNAPEDKTILEKIMCGGMIKMYDKIMEDTEN